MPNCQTQNYEITEVRQSLQSFGRRPFVEPLCHNASELNNALRWSSCGVKGIGRDIFIYIFIYHFLIFITDEALK